MMRYRLFPRMKLQALQGWQLRLRAYGELFANCTFTIASALGVGQTLWHNWLRGLSFPHRDAFLKICKALGEHPEAVLFELEAELVEEPLPPAFVSLPTLEHRLYLLKKTKSGLAKQLGVSRARISNMITDNGYRKHLTGIAVYLECDVETAASIMQKTLWVHNALGDAPPTG